MRRSYGIALEIEIGARAKAKLFVCVELRVGATEYRLWKDVYRVSSVGEAVVVCSTVLECCIDRSSVGCRRTERGSQKPTGSIVKRRQSEGEWIRIIAVVGGWVCDVVKGRCLKRCW